MLKNIRSSVYEYCLNSCVSNSTFTSNQLKKFVLLIQKYEQNGEISCLSYASYNRTVYGSKIKDVDLVKIGAANVFAWIAYYIYDAVCDDRQQTENVGIANIAMRKSFKIYAAFSKKYDVTQSLVESHFSTVDDCLLLESVNPDEINWTIQYIQERSIGHILGPVLIAEATKNVDEKNNIIKLKSYIAIKQILDDLRDFNEDLNMGRSSYVINICKTREKQVRLNKIKIQRNFLKFGIDEIISEINKLYSDAFEYEKNDALSFIMNELKENTDSIVESLKQRKDLYKSSISI